MTPCLRQGEIIANLLELPPAPSDIKTLQDEKISPEVIRRTHPLSLVITQDCDLDWDYKYRTTPGTIKKDEKDENKLLYHIQFCDLFIYDDIRFGRGLNRPLWERIQSNQDERYHHFISSQVGELETTLPDLYVDFKRVFSLPADYVYWLISTNFSKREALLPDPYLRDLIQRLFSYLSRVSIPDDEDSP